MVEVRDVRQSFMSGSGLRVKILTFTSNGSTEVECLPGSLAQRQPGQAGRSAGQFRDPKDAVVIRIRQDPVRVRGQPQCIVQQDARTVMSKHIVQYRCRWVAFGQGCKKGRLLTSLGEVSR